MKPELYAELKAMQIEAAKVAVHLAITPAYKEYKRENSQKINNLRDQYDQSVINTYDLSNQTLEGKTKEKLLETLTTLIKDDDALLYSVNTILKGNFNSSAYSRSHHIPNASETVLLSNQIVGVTDEFLKTKSKLSDGEPSLKAIKQQNNNLFSDLLGIFDKKVDYVASLFSYLSSPEVHAIAVSEGLHPDKNISRAQVSATSTYIDNKLTKIDDTITKMILVFDNLHYTDDQMASIFGISVDLIKSKKNKNKNQWVEEMESRDEETVINQYQVELGLTREEAELLYKYDQQFIEYVIREDLDPLEASQLYSALIASFPYKDEPRAEQWEKYAGTYDDEKLKKIFTEEFNFTEDEYHTLDEAITRNHNPILLIDTEKNTGTGELDENGKMIYEIELPDGTTKLSSDYNNLTDLAHVHGAMAIMLKDDLNVRNKNGQRIVGGTPNGPITVPEESEYGTLDGFATFHGDISSGGVDARDVRADADAQNRVHRMRENNYEQSPVTAADEYHDDINGAENPNKARMEELKGYYDKKGESLENDVIKAHIDDELDLGLQIFGKDGGHYNNFRHTQDDVDKTWGIIEDDLGISDETSN